MVVRGEVTHCVCVTYMQQMAAGGPSLIVCVCAYPLQGCWINSIIVSCFVQKKAREWKSWEANIYGRCGNAFEFRLIIGNCRGEHRLRSERCRLKFVRCTWVPLHWRLSVYRFCSIQVIKSSQRKLFLLRKCHHKLWSITNTFDIPWVAL